MPSILTITLNPALDLATTTEKVIAGHKLRCDPESAYPGGGGINVARVIRRLGGDCLAMYPAGGGSGERLRALLAEEGVPSHVIPIAGQTRENLSVRERSSGREFRFVMPGPSLSLGELQECENYLHVLSPAPDYVVLSGSLPAHTPADYLARLVRVAKARGSKVILDASGEALHVALQEGVYLVKPSLRELRELSGCTLEGDADYIRAVQSLIRKGGAEVVALSLGEQGALLATSSVLLRAPGVSASVESTVGAGDSLVAGLLFALAGGASLEEALRCGMAAARAALLQPGTALGRASDIEQSRRLVEIIKM